MKIAFPLAILVVVGLLFNTYQEEVLYFLHPEHLKSYILTFGWWAPVVFAFFSFILTLMFVSSAAFTIASGLLFGKLWGSILIICSSTAAAQLAFLIMRRYGSHLLERFKDKKGIGPTLLLVEERCKTNGFRNILVLRCLLVPYIVLSYAAGTVKTLKARDHFFATLTANAIFTPAFVLLGDSLLDGPRALILPAVVIALVLLIPRVLKRFVKTS